jgi:hypothetical protein
MTPREPFLSTAIHWLAALQVQRWRNRMNALANINSRISSHLSGAESADRAVRPTRAEMEEASV